jgi:hypothetical protein
VLHKRAEEAPEPARSERPLQRASQIGSEAEASPLPQNKKVLYRNFNIRTCSLKVVKMTRNYTIEQTSMYEAIRYSRNVGNFIETENSLPALQVPLTKKI